MEADGKRVLGNVYNHYPKSPFDCYITYDRHAEPNVYFSADVFDRAMSYYGKAESFDFFCLLGNIHDEDEQEIYSLLEIDPLMIDQLVAYSAKNCYDPFTSLDNEEDLLQLPIPNPDDWMADEIHFYKESKDGAFTTSRAYTFVRLEDRLCLLYRYDFSNEDSPVMLVRELPTELSAYFCALLDDLQNK